MPRIAVAADFGKIDAKANPVSLVQLINTPSKFEGMRIRVVGICLWEREGSYLFLTRDHYQAYDTESAIELACGGNLLPVPLDELAKLQGRIVSLEGLFHASGGIGGHPVIAPITRVLTRDRKEK